MFTAPTQSLLPHRQLSRFLGGAMLGLVGLFVVVRLPGIQAAVLEPWSAMLAELAARTLGVLGREVAVSGTILRTSGLSLNVTTDCSGLEVIGVYVALTLAYPAPWLQRLLYGLDPHVRFFRAWVVAIPFVLVWAVARRSEQEGRSSPTDPDEKAAATRPEPALQ